MKRKVLSLICVTSLLISTALTNLNAATVESMGNKNDNIKNIIVMIPDGMSTDAITLTRWYNSFNSQTGKVNTNQKLALDEMVSGLVRTYWQSGEEVGMITDSAPAGTAFATGVKTVDKYIGVNDKKKPIATILEGAKSIGKSTGIISTSQIQHATPADFSSHYPDRSKEEILGEQQVYNNIDVVLGGGDDRITKRADKEDLQKVIKDNGYTYATTKDQLLKADKKVWGMFAPVALANEMDRKKLKAEQPSLAEMTENAIRILNKDEDGFFLMVEGSKVDWAAHANDPIGIISETNAFDDAVKVALDFAKKDNKTMIIAMADHGNGGISIGNAETSKTYSKDPVSKFIAPLKKAVLTGEGIEEKLNQDRTNIKEVMQTYYGISDLTTEEISTIKSAEKGKVSYAVGPMISKRAYLGWTSNGHTGEDVALFTYLPNNERITGTIENTDVAKIASSVWGINLNDLSKELFIDANAASAKNGANVKVDNSDLLNPKLVVTKGNNTLEIPENKNYLLFNGKKTMLTSINVNVEGTFFVNKTVIDMFR